MSDRVLAGYRVLRLLGHGSTGDVLLGHADDGAGGADVVALRFASEATRFAGEAAALDRARGPHVLELRDASAGDDGGTLVLARLTGPDLATWLAGRGRIEAGEAVTLLAPLAATLERMHARGVAHGRLGATRVRFDEDGAPVITGFGAAVLFAPGAPEVVRERIPEVGADREALLTIARPVLERVVGSRGRPARALLERWASVPPGDLFRTMEDDLFALAAAMPIRLAPDPPEAARGPDGRVVSRREPVPSTEPSGLPARLRAVVMGLAATPPVAAVAAPLVERWERLGGRARRLVLGAGVGGAALLVAVVAVPGPARTSSATIVAPSGAPSAVVADLRVPSDAPGDPSASPGAVDPVALADAVTGDDPVRAAIALLERRRGCFAQLSTACFAEVAQVGSAALAMDRAALEASVSAGTEPAAWRAPHPVLRQRLGDSALVVLDETQPASLLLVRSEAGWRIRDYLPGS